MPDLPQTSHIKLDLRGAVLHLWLNRPELRNAINSQMVRKSWRRSPRLPMTAPCASWCCAAPAERSAPAAISGACQLRVSAAAGSADELKANNKRFGAMLDAVNAAPQVVIAAVEGYAMGGGFGLACVADITIATADARFAMSEVMIGVVAAAISPFVVQRIGLTAARRLAVTGLRIDGAEAVAVGIAHVYRRRCGRARCRCARCLQPGAQVRAQSRVPDGLCSCSLS